MKRIAFIVVALASLTSLVFSYIFLENIFFAIGGIIFYLFFFVLVHELGHVLGTKIAGGKVTEFCLSIINVKDGKFTLLDEFTFVAKVKFTAEKYKPFIFFSGIIMSFLFLAWPILEFIFLRSFHSWFYLITAGVLFIITLIPYKGSDMYRGLNK